MEKIKIGFVGQGWIGKNYADNFADRGYDVVRYALEPDYQSNKDKIKDCDVVFVAVPTPSTPQGFDDSRVRDAIRLVGKGKIAVIKSTILPGTTKSIQSEFPDVIVLHSPEFLTEATARFDADHPDRNIIGIPVNNEKYLRAANTVLSILPEAPYKKICMAQEAELIKYGGNCFFFTKVLFMNMLYDLANELGANWSVMKEAMVADPRIGPVHMDPVHKSGRGAGGHCFIKDFAAFVDLYKNNVSDDILGIKVLSGLEAKNIDLLLKTKKDLDLLAGVYGELIFSRKMTKNELINTYTEG